jgi:hypothetical protein
MLKWNLMNMSAVDHRSNLPLRPRAAVHAWQSLQRTYLTGRELTTNFLPHPAFTSRVVKSVGGQSEQNRNYSGSGPWLYLTVIDFLEHLTGGRVLFQLFPAVNKQISVKYTARYLA